MVIRLIDANKLFEEVGHIKPENLKHYDHLGNFMNMITTSPTITPPAGYKPIEGGWEYYGLPDDVVRIVRCKDCKRRGMDNCPMWEGSITEEYMFCSEGERKYNETD